MNDIYDIRLLHFIINLFTEYLHPERRLEWLWQAVLFRFLLRVTEQAEYIWLKKYSDNSTSPWNNWFC